MQLDQQIEGLLFYKAAPTTVRFLTEFFAVDEAAIEHALETLAIRLTTGATRLLRTDTEVSLVTAPDLAPLIESLRKDEMRRDIGKAGAETLAIILYRGPISRPEIDRVRGVNSSFILRNLLIRGLIEKRDNPKDQRTFLYACTPTLLSFLGITKREELPDFTEILNALDTFEKNLPDTDEQNVFIKEEAI